MTAMESNVQHSRLNDEHAGGDKDRSTPESMTKLALGHPSYHSDQKKSISGVNQVKEDVSDSESASPIGKNSSLFGSAFVRVDEEVALYQVICYKFISTLAGYGMHTHVEAIHRNAYNNPTDKAKFQSYLNFLQAMEEKNDGDCNWKYAWYCGSKEDISTVISHGFGHAVNSGIYGRGIYLSPAENPLQSLHYSTVDEDGLCHLLLCRVVLGRMELMRPGSEQCHPSSEQFDSGVDNLSTPTKYIVWCTHMNTPVLPEFVISIRAPPVPEKSKRFTVMGRPRSPWIPFSIVMSCLLPYLGPDSLKLIQKYHTDHIERKITRVELIDRVRQITGDALLIGVLKSYKDKLKASKGSKPTQSSTNCSTNPRR